MSVVPVPPVPPSQPGSQEPWDRRNVAELSQTNFRTTKHGFDRDEVRAILDRIAADYRVLQMQNASLHRQLADVEAVLQAYYHTEEPNATALVVKQTVQRANDEARAILMRAQTQAEDTMARVAALAREVEGPIKQLEQDRKHFQVLVADTISEMLTILSAAEGAGTNAESSQPSTSQPVEAASAAPDTSLPEQAVNTAPEETGTLVPISIVSRKPELRVVASSAPPSKVTHAGESIDTVLKDLDQAMLQISALPDESL